MVSRIPDGSRFATLTEAPNNERMRYATGGPKPKSPPGVLASPIEKRSKNFAKAALGIDLPRLSMMTLCEFETTSHASKTVSPSSENLTAVSSSACNALDQQILISEDEVQVRRWRGERHVPGFGEVSRPLDGATQHRAQGDTEQI